MKDKVKQARRAQSRPEGPPAIVYISSQTRTTLTGYLVEVPGLGDNVEVLAHEKDLYEEKDKSNPTAGEGSNGKAVEESRYAMCGHGCQDKDCGDGVEDEVEDCHSQL